MINFTAFIAVNKNDPRGGAEYVRLYDKDLYNEEETIFYEVHSLKDIYRVLDELGYDDEYFYLLVETDISHHDYFILKENDKED